MVFWTTVHVLEIKYDILQSKLFHPAGSLFLISACPIYPYIPIMMMSHGCEHWVQHRCVGSMSHRCDKHYASNSSKVFFVISYLKKSMLDWFEIGVMEIDPRLAPSWHSNWPDFIAEICTHFGPSNPTGMAEIKLHHLSMQPDSRISEYLVRFNMLASRVSWGDVVLHFQFYDGLPEQLKDKITILGKPESL